MLITISGTIASGKTTLAKKIIEKFSKYYNENFEYLSAGDIMRKMASERNMSLLELSKIAEKDFEIDRKIDATQREIVKNFINQRKSCVVDGRISWYILKDFDICIKIFLDAPIEVRAKRFSEREHYRYEDAIKKIKMREASERRRYKKIYKIDVNDISNYDIYLNAGKWNADSVCEIVSKAIIEIIKSKEN